MMPVAASLPRLHDVTAQFVHDVLEILACRSLRDRAGAAIRSCARPGCGPGRADITNTRSARNTASRRSWVTRTTVILRAACRSRITHHSSSRVKASSAPNGSSSISSCGSWISARHSEVRCCMPPDNCHGNLLAEPPRPTEASSVLRALDIFAPCCGGFRRDAAARFPAAAADFRASCATAAGSAPETPCRRSSPAA